MRRGRILQEDLQNPLGLRKQHRWLGHRRCTGQLDPQSFVTPLTMGEAPTEASRDTRACVLMSGNALDTLGTTMRSGAADWSAVAMASRFSFRFMEMVQSRG